MSYRVSFMRPVVFDPGLFGEYGGPANGGFAGTGTNTSSSTAVTWTRVFSAEDRARRARRPELLPQRHRDHRRRTDDRAPRSAFPAPTSTSTPAAFPTSTSAAMAIPCLASPPASHGTGPRRPGTSRPR